MALWLLPFSVVQRRVQHAQGKSLESHPLERIVWAVRAVSRCIPGATCLTQAMAAQLLLARSGYASRVQIGVAKDDQQRFQAHAWLVHKEEVLLGAATVDRYVPIAAWEA